MLGDVVGRLRGRVTRSRFESRLAHGPSSLPEYRPSPGGRFGGHRCSPGHPSRHPACQYPGRARHGPDSAGGFQQFDGAGGQDCLARGGHARGRLGLRFPRADRPHESCAGLSDRFLFDGRVALSHADRPAAVSGQRSAGMDALPYRPHAAVAARHRARRAASGVGHRDEAARQTAGGSLPKHARSAVRPGPMPRAMAGIRPYRAVRARRGRHFGALPDPAQAVRT